MCVHTTDSPFSTMSTPTSPATDPSLHPEFASPAHVKGAFIDIADNILDVPDDPRDMNVWAQQAIGIGTGDGVEFGYDLEIVPRYEVVEIIQKLWRQFVFKISTLWQMIEHFKLESEPVDLPRSQQSICVSSTQLNRFIKITESACRILVGSLLAKMNLHDLHDIEQSNDSAPNGSGNEGLQCIESKVWQIVENDKKDKYDPYQECLLSVLDNVDALGLRLHGDTLWQQRRDAEGRATHAWKPLRTIEEHVYIHFDSFENHKGWRLLTSKMGMVAALVLFLANTRDVRMPRLVFNRRAMAFRNGVYMLDTNRFHEGGEGVPNDLVCISYFDEDLDERYTMLDNYMDIPTPDFDCLFDVQMPDEYTDQQRTDVKEALYALLGRLLRKNGSDRLEKIIFMKGVGGSGKSTVVNVLKSFYPLQVVSTMSANIEEQFGMANFKDAYLVVCPEMRANSKIPVGDLLCWISNEPMYCAVKYGTPYIGTFDATLIITGNEQPPDFDVGGAMMRRIIPWRADKQIVDPDLSLEKRQKENMAPLLVKLVRADKSFLLERHRNKDVWGKDDEGRPILPPLFHEHRKKMHAEMHQLVAFIGDSEYTLHHPDVYCKFSDFARDFSEYQTASGLKKKPFNEDLYLNVFQKKGLVVVEREERAYPIGNTVSQTAETKWIAGICKRDPREIDPDALADILALERERVERERQRVRAQADHADRQLRNMAPPGLARMASPLSASASSASSSSASSSSASSSSASSSTSSPWASSSSTLSAAASAAAAAAAAAAAVAAAATTRSRPQSSKRPPAGTGGRDAKAARTRPASEDSSDDEIGTDDYVPS